jgi:hypothetical protein
VYVTVAESDPLHTAGDLEVHDVVQNDLGAKPFGWGLDFDHAVRAQDAVRKPGNFSTSVVVTSSLPASTALAMTSGLRQARPA